MPTRLALTDDLLPSALRHIVSEITLPAPKKHMFGLSIVTNEDAKKWYLMLRVGHEGKIYHTLAEVAANVARPLSTISKHIKRVEAAVEAWVEANPSTIHILRPTSPPESPLSYGITCASGSRVWTLHDVVAREVIGR